MKTKDIAIALFALILVATLGYLWFSPSGVKPAPAVAVTALDGSRVAIDQYRGRPLLVTFWATTCPGCVQEIPHMVELYRDLGPRGLQVLAIAMDYDPPAQVANMAKQRQLPYIVAIDKDGAAAKAFGDVKLTPTSFLIDPQGRIVQQKLGDLDFAQLRQRIEGMLTQRAGA